MLRFILEGVRRFDKSKNYFNNTKGDDKQNI